MNFDRVAQIYDATRGYEPVIAERVTDRILDVTGAGPRTHFLELGVGTGRIAVPFVQRGYPYTGMDISRDMMAQLRAKVGDAPNLELIEGDIREIPLPAQSVDVVVLVHILHLVPEWQEVLHEVRRVLRPGGAVVLGHDAPEPSSPAAGLRRAWHDIVEELGGMVRPENGGWSAVERYLIQTGGWPTIYRAAAWTREFVPASFIDALHNRAYSQTWSIPDAVLNEAHTRLQAWARERYGNPEQAITSRWEFLLSVTRFPPEPQTQHPAE